MYRPLSAVCVVRVGWNNLKNMRQSTDEFTTKVEELTDIYKRMAGIDEAMDGDAVEDMMDTLQAIVNAYQGNI